jgi:hypothetical protein
VAYRADIEIGVKGAAYLDQLQNKLTQVSRAIDTLNAKEVVVRRTIAGAAYATPAGPGGSGVTRASAVAASAAIERQVAQTRRTEAQAELKIVKDRGIAENYISGVINRRLAAKTKELELEQQQTAEVEKRAASERRKRTENVALGAGFPLLFGAGPGAVIGGALGGLIPGNPMLSVVTSAIGAQLDAAVLKISELGIGLRELNFDRLEQSGLRISQVLKEQVQLLVRLGQTSQAYQVLQQEAARITGTLPGTITDISNATGILNKAWAEFTTVASTTLGIVGAPFAAALGGLVKLVSELLKGVNSVVSLFAEGLKTVGEWSIRLIAGEEGLKRVRDLIDSINKSTGQGNAAFVQSDLIPLNEEIVLNKQILDLQKQRTAETNLSGKIQNSNIAYSVQALKNEQKYTESVVALNEKKNSLSKEIYQQGLKQLQVIRDQSNEYAQQTRDLDIQQARRQEAERVLREQEEQARKRQQAIEEAAREAQRYRQSLLNLSKEENELTAAGLDIYADYLKATKGVEASVKSQVTYFDDYVQSRLVALHYERAAAVEAAKTAREEEKIVNINNLKKQQLENQLATRQALLRTQQLQFFYESGEAQGVLSRDKQLSFEKTFTQFQPDVSTAFSAGVDFMPAQGLATEAAKVKTELLALLDPIKQVTVAAESIGEAFSTSFKGLVSGAMSAQQALAGFFQSVADQFLDMAAQMIAKWIQLTILNSILKLFPSGPATGAASGGYTLPTGAGYAGGFSLSSLLPGRASGGPVTGGSPYIVGERGPELFVPGRSGSIVPNNQLAGGGDTNVVVNVDASGSKVEGDDQQGKQLGRVIAAAVQQEIIKQKRPGGLLV